MVTDDQDPGLHDDGAAPGSRKRKIALKIVDHRVIFRGYEQYLPTFNSSSIHTYDLEDCKGCRKDLSISMTT
ncbi:MAG: hypothetical protein MZV63_48265 [Marinilabiliales bacterium]|nr:hypothetical protein [Marinilabiliales bacterium]